MLTILLFSTGVRADELQLYNNKALEQGVSLQKNLLVWEDASGSSSVEDALQQVGRFIPLQTLQPQKPTSTYWVLARANIQMPQPALDVVLAFTHLTFVDLYLFRDSQAVLHRQAGAFQPAQNLYPGDSRFHFQFPLQGDHGYTFLLKVVHTKHYQPNFDFTLQTKDAYTAKSHRQDLVNIGMLGAISLFFLYTLLSWLVSRFRPYLWLLLYIGGVGLYSLSMSGYFIDWFFPHTPETGWLFNIHFLHAGLLGLYLLIIDFWHLKQKVRWLYYWGLAVVAGVVVVSIASFLINYFLSDYNLMNNINLWSYILPFSFISAALWHCWGYLNRAQRFLAYGIMLFAVAGLVTTLSSALLHERSIHIAPYISHVAILGVVLLFSTGLKEELRLYEMEKNTALHQLNVLQHQQNSLLEQKVHERTQELQQSNRELTAQQAMLAERNTKIEVLINELNHRVKNNLQLLYSLVHLKLPRVSDAAAQEILKGHSAKIKAMMLVNEQLSRFQDQAFIGLQAFASELAHYVRSIYDPAQRVVVHVQIPEDVQLSGKETLSFGLMLSELLTNSFKYAFGHQPDPRIEIRVSRLEAAGLQFIYADNGKGFAGTEASGGSMGLMLIQDLARQLNGRVDICSENGVTYTFSFTL